MAIRKGGASTPLLNYAGLILSLVLGALLEVEALDNGLALTPPMGWLSWERFTCTTDCASYPNDCVSSQLYRSMADRLVADGYAKLGYEYVNIDDCWSERQRDPTYGVLVENKTLFPEGIDGLAKYVHAKRLKLGIYGDCGTATCAGYPAQLNTETNLEDNNFARDANLLALWEVDSFKFDGCNLDPGKAESICPKMALAIAENQRPMMVICEWPFYMLREVYNAHNPKMQPNFELAAKACNAWRYYEDVEDSWLSILGIISFSVKIQSTILKYHGPGHWFDPDQLIIGNFALSLDQARAQMAIWSIWSAPLYMSNDLRQIEPEMAAVLKNEHLIEVDQDRLGVFGLMMAQSKDGQHQAFAKPVLPIANGCPSFVIVYLNRNTLGNTREISFKLRDLLVGLPLNLASQRYNKLIENEQSQSKPSPSPEFKPDQCKKLLQLGMTRPPGASSKPLLNKPLNQAPEENIEEKRVYFSVLDLFGDEKSGKIQALADDLNLKVNPSGVRAIKLTLLPTQ